MKANYNFSVKNDVKSESHSWGLVIFLLIIFWPVGLFFLVRKMSIDRQASLSSGRKMTIWGWVIISIGLMFWLSTIEDGFFSGTFGMLFFVIAGVALVRVGKKATINAVKHKKYIDLIVNKSLRSISSIASAIPVTHDIAIIDIQEMIKKGYFDNIYINFNTDEVVFIQADSVNNNSAINSFSDRKIEMQLVSCNGCGANNKVETGEVGQCLYCGSLISR
ncbi:hypothetical protein [Sporosarcina sp. FA9]|uniref:hypothetical protein n=1 Tax=Sporosarcina sp. FA9 TaxID=3413030 RepID=UPI003F65555E